MSFPPLFSCARTAFILMGPICTDLCPKLTFSTVKVHRLELRGVVKINQVGLEKDFG